MQISRRFFTFMGPKKKTIELGVNGFGDRQSTVFGVPPQVRECGEHFQNLLMDLVIGISITFDSFTFCSFCTLGIPVRLE